MLSLHKTVRKYFGEAIVVTQEVEDIISSPIVKESIINNADSLVLRAVAVPSRFGLLLAEGLLCPASFAPRLLSDARDRRLLLTEQ